MTSFPDSSAERHAALQRRSRGARTSRCPDVGLARSTRFASSAWTHGMPSGAEKLCVLGSHGSFLSIFPFSCLQYVSVMFAARPAPIHGCELGRAAPRLAPGFARSVCTEARTHTAAQASKGQPADQLSVLDAVQDRIVATRIATTRRYRCAIGEPCACLLLCVTGSLMHCSASASGRAVENIAQILKAATSRTSPAACRAFRERHAKSAHVLEAAFEARAEVRALRALACPCRLSAAHMRQQGALQTCMHSKCHEREVQYWE